MINKVGISNLDTIKTQYFKKTSLEIEVILPKDMPDINKITSIMFSEKDIFLEKTNLGILYSFLYRLKIMYIPINSDTLHLFEENNFFNTEIQTESKLYWDTLKKLIKGNRLIPHITTYEITVKKITTRSIFIKVFFLLEINYPSYYNIGLKISNKENHSNLYLTDYSFKELQQITFEYLNDLKKPYFDGNEPLIYYIKPLKNAVLLEAFNIKLKKSTTILDDFIVITDFKVYDNIILFTGENIFFKGLFSYIKTTKEIENLRASDFILDFALIDSKIFILESIEEKIVLNTISENNLLLESSFSISYLTGQFLKNLKSFVYINKDGDLNILSLETFKEITIVKNTNFKNIFFINHLKSNLIIGFEIDNTNRGILTYNIETAKLKYLLNKPLKINSMGINKERELIYLSIDNNSSTELISIDKKNKIKCLSKFNDLNIEFFIF